MNKVLVTKDVNYGASKTSSTKNTATNPQDLADGALGIYGIDPTSANNANKLALITDGGADGAGVVPAAAPYAGTSVFFAVGTATGCVLSPEVTLAGSIVFSKAYTAGVLGVAYIGYNLTTTVGDISFPAVVSKNDELLITANDLSEKDNILRIGTPYSGYAAIDSANEYDVLLSLVTSVDADPERVFEADIVAKGTDTYIEASAATADPTLTNGSKTVTFAADPGIGVGSVLTIRGSIYKIAVENSATNYTLDRPYKGASETIDISATTETVGTIASITNWGLKLTDKAVNSNVKYAVTGLGVSAPIVYQVVATPSVGAYQDIADKEFAYKAHRGTLVSTDRTVPVPDSLAVVGTNYDQYIIKAGNEGVEKGIQNLHNVDVNVHIAFPDAIADSAGKNQSDFEDAMANLVSGFVSII